MRANARPAAALRDYFTLAMLFVLMFSDLINYPFQLPRHAVAGLLAAAINLFNLFDLSCFVLHGFARNGFVSVPLKE